MKHDVETVFDLLDKVDNNGVLTLNFSNEELIWFDKMNEANKLPRFKTNTETAQFIMDNIFGEWGIFDLPLMVKKTVLKKIDLSTSKNDKFFTVKFDLFKYLNIKKNDPKKQIQEIKEFFKLSKKFMDQVKIKSKHNHYFSGTVKILNSKTNNGKTIYEILLQSWDGKQFNELNQQLIHKVKKSETLTDLLTQTCLNLNKIGPHAWATIKFEALDSSSLCLK